jgi:ArsR family transcriptional regulator, arsenate/arsenite/antimonite-responsive transcriptional repressor
MQQKDISKMSAIFKALSDETRLHIVYIVANEGRCGTLECSKGLDLSQPTLSHHIKILINANILTVQKVGTAKKYSFNKDYLDKLGIQLQHKVSSL